MCFVGLILLSFFRGKLAPPPPDGGLKANDTGGLLKNRNGGYESYGAMRVPTKEVTNGWV